MPYRKELRILDLACGDARVAIASSLVHQGKIIHYFGVDKNQYSSEFGFSTSREKGLKKIFLGNHETKWRKEWEEAKSRLNVRLEKKKLAFDNPSEFSAQLDELFGGKKFDEIHFHMPSFSSHQPVGVLKAIAARLKPGGRIFHTVEGPAALASRSPVLDFKYSGDYYADREKLLALCEKAGLVLDKSVVVEGEQFDPKYFMPRRNLGKNVETSGLSKKAFDKAVGMLSAYSAWDGLMGFLAVFKKPLRRNKP